MRTLAGSTRLRASLFALLAVCACEVRMRVPLEPRAQDDDDGVDERPIECDGPPDCADVAGRPLCNELGYCVECITRDDCGERRRCETDDEPWDWECDGSP